MGAAPLWARSSIYSALIVCVKMATVCPDEVRRALKDNEKGVVDSLESVDKEHLKCLCGEAVEIGVIPQDVRKSLESMDWENVSRPRVIRYLLMHTYKSIGENLRLYERWLDLLRKYYKMSTPLASSVSAQVMRLTEGISDDLLVVAEAPRVADANPMVSGTKRPKVQDIISEKHISKLTEVLVKCAHKWENISIALGLPESVRKDLREKQAASTDCIVCFNQLLTRWVLGRYEHARTPTIDNLEEVLNSNLVGLGAEAEKLRGIDLNQLSFSDGQPPLPKKPRLECPSLEIVRQSYDTIVLEGKSTLLEVQAVTNQDVDIHYQWLKDGYLLNKRCIIKILYVFNDAGLSFTRVLYKC